MKLNARQVNMVEVAKQSDVGKLGILVNAISSVAGVGGLQLNPSFSPELPRLEKRKNLNMRSVARDVPAQSPDFLAYISALILEREPSYAGLLNVVKLEEKKPKPSPKKEAAKVVPVKKADPVKEEAKVKEVVAEKPKKATS